MKRVKIFFKRTLVILLASMSLSLSVGSSYQQGATAYATAVPVAVDGLMYLFEFALSGMGIAVGYDVFNELFGCFDDSVQSELVAVSPDDAERIASLRNLRQGDRIDTKEYAGVIEDMQGFISNAVTLGNTISANSDGSVSINSSMQAISNLYLGGAKCDDYLSSFEIPNASKFLFIESQYDGSNVAGYSLVYTLYYSSHCTEKGSYFYSEPNTTEVNNLYLKCVNVSNPISSLKVGVSSDTGLLTYIKRNTDSRSYIFDNLVNGFSYWSTAICNAPVFTSATLSVASTIAGLSLYHCLSNAITIPESIVVGGLDAVQAADDAIAKNPDATDDELAAAVTAAMAEQLEAEQETTQAVIEGNTWLEKIFNLLQSALNSIISALSAMGFLSTIASYLQQVLSFPVEIAQQVAKVIPSYDVIVNAIQALPQAINGALDIPILGDILEVIISIPGTLADILEGLLTIPGVITDVVGGLAIPLPDLGILSDILEGVIAIPGALADVLEGIIAIPGIIVDAIEMVFTFDMAAVEVAADGLADAWELKLPFIPAFKNMFNKISFPDEYDYPVIKIQTPNALKEFWDHDYIILFNGEDFAPYFVYVRGITRAAIWILFAYSLLNRFKVRFHVG